MRGAKPDLTARRQMLDWFKRGSGPSSNAGIFALYRQRADALRRGQAVQTLSGRHLNIAADGTVEMTETDAAPLLAVGWAKVDDTGQRG